MPINSVEKYSIYTTRERITFAALTALFSYFLLRYSFWWFQASHIPNNWFGSNLHIFDFGIFGALSLVAFISFISNIGSHFALWHAKRPKYMLPEGGLRVAFLTCFVPDKEPIGMLIETLLAMRKVRYSHDTWVLDEGDSDEVKEICRNLDVKYFTRFGVAKYNQEKGKFRTRTKAGNHNAWANEHAKNYDIVAQIDMDHVPQADYFERTLGYFRDPEVATVGMPQFYKNTENWIARGAAEQSYFFHGPMQKGFYGADMPFLIGTSHIYRTSAMDRIGGYAPTIVEDHLTGMNFYANGYKGVFVPEILARGEGPLNWVDYFNQQMRWSYGLFEIFFKHTPKIISKLKWRQKINYFIAQLYYFTGVAVVVGFVLTFIYLVFGVRAASMDLFEWLRFSIPPYLLSVALQIYTHRFNIDPENEPVFGPLGMFLNLGANLIYALAFVKFILGGNLKYMVTQKGQAGKNQKVPISTFKVHLVFAFLMCFALIESFYTKHTAIQLRLWALFNVVTILGLVSSIYWENIRSRLGWFKLSYKPARNGVTFALGIMIVVSLMFAYTQSANVVKAFFDKQFVQNQLNGSVQMDEPVASKIVPVNHGAYLGVSLYQHNDTNYLSQLQNDVGKKFKIVSYYQSWGVDDNKFDKNWARNIAENGSIPMITWEPWRPISGYDRSESVVNQPEYRLNNITSGQYDDYIKQYAQDVKAYKKPVMIRFAHEMNGNWYPWGSTFNQPQDYVLAWRHVHEIFDNIGASNVTWVWSPNEVYSENKVPYSDRIELFYPGDDYVDWVGFSAFNWAGTYKNNTWKSPEDLYDATLTRLIFMNKPIMITETASAETADPTQKAQWIQDVSWYVQNHPQVAGIVWFNTVDNGVNWQITSSQNSTNAFKMSFGDYFIKGK